MPHHILLNFRPKFNLEGNFDLNRWMGDIFDPIGERRVFMNHL